MKIRTTTEDFINRAIKVHGNKYDYSKSIYLGYKKKLVIICPTHGEFEQTPCSHLNGSCCPKCSHILRGKNSRLSTDEFIERAINAHGDKYDYTETVYTSAHGKVSIKCPIHGVFKQEATAHLNGQGCPMCGRIKATSSICKGREEFIEEAKKIHGDRYDYSLVKYKNSTTNVTIICPVHGEFLIQPNHHLEGSGCQKCSREKNANKTRLNTEEFIERAKKVHGDKYDYSKVEYVDSKTKVNIICPMHGEFLQTPNDHLNGRGCSICNESRLEREIRILFNSKNIEYIREKTFDWLGQKRLDFYLPKYSLVVECQGEQHFNPIEHFGGAENLEIVINSDNLKKKLCEEHGINILYYSDLNIDYPYDVITDKDKLIEVIKKKAAESED